jgi:hypothetical protein
VIRGERTATGKEDGEEDDESAPQITAEGHCSGAGTFPLDSAGAQTKPTYYLALRDSLSIGEQPIGTGPHGWTHDGYTDQLAQTLRVENPGLRLIRPGFGRTCRESSPRDFRLRCSPRA